MVEIKEDDIMEEKYYWINNDGEKIPKSELSDLHVCNIIAKFGKIWLEQSGHKVLVNRFENLNKKYKYFYREDGDGITDGVNTFSSSELEYRKAKTIIISGYDESDDLLCPTCKGYVGCNEDGLNFNYCPDCGQKLSYI